MPALRAAASPLFFCRTTRMGSRSTAAIEPSVEPSSTTTISMAGRRSAKRLSTAFLRKEPAL